MTDEDFPAFEVLMTKLRFVFRLRATTEEFATLCEMYFKALRIFSVADLQTAADRFLEHGKGFPRPAEWRADVPRRTAAPTQWPVATDLEARLYADARQLHFEEAPCLCRACVTAGVSDLPRRFVPDRLADGQDRRLRHPQTGQSFVMGHWAHGEELALWHLAREQARTLLNVGNARTTTRGPMAALVEIVRKALPS